MGAPREEALPTKGLCEPCFKALASLGFACGSGPESLAKPECKPFFCRVTAECPANPSKTPIGTVTLDQYKQGLDAISANVSGCPEHELSGTHTVGGNAVLVLAVGAL